MKWTQKTNEILKEFKTSKHDGLTSEGIKINKQEYGSNELVGKKGESIFKMIIDELKQFLNLLLLGAAIISLVFHPSEPIDGIFIIVIVILNVFLSVYQENNAKNAVNALKALSAPKAKVIRDGEITEIDSTEVVVGDIVVIEAGDYVPADCRLIESVNLKIDESALTGESVPVEKDADKKLEENTPLGDRVNMAYSSTIVTYGRGVGVVTGVGMSTEIGAIASMLNEVEDELTPLQEKIDSLGKTLGLLSIIVVLIIFVVGFVRLLLDGHPILTNDGINEEVLELFLVSVSLAVAAIPEGLPTVITIVLSIGMRAMAKQNAIVKQLSAVETLGSTTVISSDKTGTLTQNKMVVKKVFVNGELLEVTGNGYSFEGEISGSNNEVDMLNTIGVLCNDSVITNDNVIGDPTELALVTLAHKNKMDHKQLRETYPRLDEYPFDSDRKLMSTLHKLDNNTLLTKGAFDQLLKVCDTYLENGEVKPIDKKFVNRLNKANLEMASNALRVLGFAYKQDGLDSYDDINKEESNMTFVGLVGIIDPPREEVKEAIRICHKAGVRVVMITGDHKVTATAIGQELGIIKDISEAISGEEIDKLSHEEFLSVVKKTNVYARVSPENKVMIVKAMQENGEIASMTGDGVNDAPALKQADIGVAMGITGTDVSKEAADMVLMDDNFTTIVKSVEEGRVIYSNIRKFVGYLVSCNVGEVLIIFLAMLFLNESPLLAIQILWINLVTDTFPAFALGLEKKEKDVMASAPNDPNVNIVDNQMLVTIGFQSVFLTTAVLLSYLLGKSIGTTLEVENVYHYGTTFAFITIITGELLRTFSARSEKQTVFSMNLFENKWVNYATLFGLVMLLVVVFVPGVNTIFKTDVNIGTNFFIAFGLGFIPLFGGELAKIFKK